MRHLLRMRGSRTALQTASLVVWRPPIPGAPRSGEPGTHKHECLDAIAQPGPKSVYGPGLVAARPILEWVDRRAPNFQFRCCAPHLPSPHPKTIRGAKSRATLLPSPAWRLSGPRHRNNAEDADWTRCGSTLVTGKVSSFEERKGTRRFQTERWALSARRPGTEIRR